MKVKFWGVRGSIPCPGPLTVKYGGNTACVELRIKETDRQFIIDAGSGIRDLGSYMMRHDLPKGPIRTDIIITHTHIDHILGLPFFTPIYIKGTKLRIYGPATYEDETLENVISGQFTYRYFPIRRTELASEMEFITLKEEKIDMGDGVRLVTQYLNHPILCLGYRFEYREKVICTIYDTEPFRNIFCTDRGDPSYDENMSIEGDQAARDANERVEAFFYGADLLIYDAQYTQAEYESSKVGWGHTSIEHAVATARLNRVKRLALFHHDPMRTDEQIDALAAQHCSIPQKGDTKIFFAHEGMQIEL